jgi:hypothetical protein
MVIRVLAAINELVRSASIYQSTYSSFYSFIREACRLFCTSLWLDYRSIEVCELHMQQLGFQRLAKSVNCSSH